MTDTKIAIADIYIECPKPKLECNPYDLTLPIGHK
jgi:hypothetical protein